MPAAVSYGFARLDAPTHMKQNGMFTATTLPGR